MRPFLLSISILLTSLIHIPGWSQHKEEELFSGDLRNFDFDRLVRSIEGQTSYRFFYDKTLTDTLTIDLQARQMSISQVLQELFEGSNLYFAIDPDKNVFITYDRQILTELPADFFGTPNTASGESRQFDFSDYEQEERKRKSQENRLFIIGNKAAGLEGAATLAGYVRDHANGEAVVGASVFIESPLIGVATNQFGFFSITLPKGKHELKIQSLDMKPTSRQILLYSEGRLNIEMTEQVVSLKEIEIKSERDVKVVSLQMGLDRLDLKTLRQTPVALGEADVIKVMLTMPGVQTVGEGASGINVRGGATSQNLILLNDAVIFNPSHLFGFFSAFNPDALKNADLFKSGISAEYGGRLSSVLNVTLREGNKKRISGMGGISPITGRFVLEGPIVKEKASFMVGGRSTYSGWLLKQLDSQSFQNSQASFYDVNASVSYSLSDKDDIFVSAYTSRDKFKLNNDTAYRYQDQNVALKYKRVFNNRFYGVLTGSTSQYKFSMLTERNPVNAFEFAYDIRLFNPKVDFNYFFHPKHNLTFGASSIQYRLQTGEMKPRGDESQVLPELVQPEQANENALYVGDNFEMNEKMSLYGGLRYSFYHFTGPHKMYLYSPGAPRETTSIQDSVYFQKGKRIAGYDGLEPRVSARYLLNRTTSVKLSYNRTRQYVHMLSNTIAISPTDAWKLSDAYVKPQTGNQISMGLYHNTRRDLEFSIEVYGKSMKNFLDYKNGAVLFLNQNIASDVISTYGKAYGAEFLMRKASGKLNGWINYTYSRSLLQTRHEFQSETVNHGKFYPANFDKPHAFNMISNYRFSHRLSFSFNLTYSTGRPITVPLAKYEFSGSARLTYSERNQFRIPDYFRMDVALNLEGNHKLKKLAHGSWSGSIYNLTGRKNAYSVYFVSKDGTIKGYQLSVFARPLPTITYNFRF